RGRIRSRADHRRRLFSLSRGPPRAHRHAQRRDLPPRRCRHRAPRRGRAGRRRAAIRASLRGPSQRRRGAPDAARAFAPCATRKPPTARADGKAMSDVVAGRLERMARFVKRMNEVERDLSSPYVRPKDAATLILVDRAGRVPKVLLGKRHHGHKFMPGKFVFPGGRANPAARRPPAARPLDPSPEAHLKKRLQRPSAEKSRAFALAAIRETFEETGLLLG